MTIDPRRIEVMDDEMAQILRDITGILKRQGDAIDRSYLERWVAQLDVSDIWRAVVQRVEQR